MLFEITVFLATLYNGFARPRASGIPLAGVLHRDGALFFFVRDECYVHFRVFTGKNTVCDVLANHQPRLCLDIEPQTGRSSRLVRHSTSHGHAMMH